MLGYRIQDTAPEGYWYAGADINMRRLLQRSAADKMASWLIAMASCRQSAVPWLPVSDQCLSMLCGVPKTHSASTPTSPPTTNIHNPKKKKVWYASWPVATGHLFAPAALRPGSPRNPETHTPTAIIVLQELPL